VNNYYDFLEKLVEDFLPILRKVGLDSVYFGGGSPNYFPVSKLKHILDLLDEFDIERSIDLEPTVIIDELYDEISRFDFVDLGVQSFDQSILSECRRRYASPEDVAEVVEKLKQHNRTQHVGIDILYKLTDSDTKERFEKDFEISKKLNLDWVSFGTEYSHVTEETQEYLKKNCRRDNRDLFGRGMSLRKSELKENIYMRKHMWCYENDVDSVIGLGAHKNSIHPTCSALYIDGLRHDVLSSNEDRYELFVKNETRTHHWGANIRELYPLE
jgi:tRNA A37 methylthiotransferase MiaB